MRGMNLPERWEVVSLSNQRLFSFENGIWKGKKVPLEECAVVRNTNFTSDGYLDLADVAVLHIEQRHLAKKKLKWGDIIIERSGGGPKQPVGRVVFFDLNDGKYCFSNFTSRLRVVDENTVSPFYLFFYLLYFYHSGQTRKLQRRTVGIRNLSFEDYKDARIPLPPLPEQCAIAHVLQTIQEAKSTRQRELALERERKAALMDYLFSHGTKGESRKQTEIGEIPESWEVVELGNYSELITKGSSPKWQGFDYCDKGIYFVRSQNVGLGRLESNEIAYLPKEFNKKEKKSILQKNDLLINIVGASIGRAAVADDIVEGGNVNQAVAIARLKQGVEPFFVMTFLLTLGGQFQLHKQKKDIARANLSLQDIKNLLIPLPSVSAQTETVEILQACDTKIAALEQEAERLDELFHAMLDELMTGQRSAVPLIDAELPN